MGDGKGVSMTPSSEAPVEIRIIGKATRWDVSDEDAPTAIGDSASSFSMIKKAIARRSLIPTIKPFSAPIDPESVKREQEWRRLNEATEEDELRRAIEDVRKAKAEHGADWEEFLKPRKGIDYWVEGEVDEGEAAEDEDETARP